jgi:hypothetical protein
VTSRSKLERKILKQNNKRNAIALEKTNTKEKTSI